MRTKRLHTLLITMVVVWVLILTQSLIVGLHFGVGSTQFVPMLIPTIIVYLAFFSPSPFGACVAFVCGLCFDVATAARLGPWAGASVALYGVLACTAQRIVIDSAFATIVATSVCSIATALLAVALSFGATPWSSDIMLSIVINGVIAGVLSPLLFIVYRRVIPLVDGRTVR